MIEGEEDGDENNPRVGLGGGRRLRVLLNWKEGGFLARKVMPVSN